MRDQGDWPLGIRGGFLQRLVIRAFFEYTWRFSTKVVVSSFPPSIRGEVFCRALAELCAR